MNQYLVYFREGKAKVDATTVKAFRVEGWSNDYAFFGHPGNLGEPTRLFPREIVEKVELTYPSGHEDPLSKIQQKYTREKMN